MKGRIFVALTAAILSLSAVCPQPQVRETISIKELRVYPEFRCEGDDVTFEWSLTGDGKLFVNALVNWNGEERSGEVFFSVDDNGAATIDLSEIEETFRSGDNAGFNFGEGFQFPNEFVLEFVPSNNTQTEKGPTQEKTVHTFYGNERISREAGRRDSENLFIVDLPAPIWSSNLMVDEIKLLSGCTDPISGTYEYDKGPETPNPEPLKQENGYTDHFTSAIQAQGQWGIKPLDMECDKSVTTLRVEFNMFCPTTR